VRKAIHTALNDHRYSDAAQRIAASMAQAPGIAQLADIVDELTATSAP
jgi:UDP:flavonoid glycosyltransferase YjiC (YdhE family)